jgi:hypothetical protein
MGGEVATIVGEAAAIVELDARDRVAGRRATAALEPLVPLGPAMAALLRLLGFLGVATISSISCGFRLLRYSRWARRCSARFLSKYSLAPSGMPGHSLTTSSRSSSNSTSESCPPCSGRMGESGPSSFSNNDLGGFAA